MNKELAQLFERDLQRLAKEINVFKEETHLWQTTGQVANSAGNLCLHLVGNLKNFIGKNLGGHDYTRHRDAEFSNKSIPRTELLRQLQETSDIVLSTLNNLEEASLNAAYPEEVLGYPMTTRFFLVHLATHLSYHTGQVNYLRRMLE